ncbi:MAG: ATP-binding cassette domain-containing protein, partial [Paraburkholderia nemoris]
SSADTYTDDECREALITCRLSEYADRLQESGHWTRILSPGEQQRLAGARVLLHKPDYLFLDEATSALDSENEARLYHLFTERTKRSTSNARANRLLREQHEQRERHEQHR